MAACKIPPRSDKGLSRLETAQAELMQGLAREGRVEFTDSGSKLYSQMKGPSWHILKRARTLAK